MEHESWNCFIFNILNLTCLPLSYASQLLPVLPRLHKPVVRWAGEWVIDSLLLVSSPKMLFWFCCVYILIPHSLPKCLEGVNQTGMVWLSGVLEGSDDPRSDLYLCYTPLRTNTIYSIRSLDYIGGYGEKWVKPHHRHFFFSETLGKSQPSCTSWGCYK